MVLNLKIKSVAYSSQGSHTGQLDSATDWQMAVRLDNVISITLRQALTWYCIVLYCIDGVVIAAQCTATFQRSIVLPRI